MLEGCKDKHIAKCNNPNLCITEHFDNDVCYLVIINHSTELQGIGLEINPEYVFDKVYRGSEEVVKPFDAAVLKYVKR